MAEDWARPVVHWEIQAKDVDAQRAFYGALFNWQMSDGPNIRIAPGVEGPLPGPGGTLRGGAHPGVSLYIQVLDLASTLAKAETLGGKALVPVTHNPGGASIAGILDPEGNRVMLVQQ